MYLFNKNGLFLVESFTISETIEANATQEEKDLVRETVRQKAWIYCKSLDLTYRDYAAVEPFISIFGEDMLCYSWSPKSAPEWIGNQALTYDDTNFMYHGSNGIVDSGYPKEDITVKATRRF